MAIIIGGPSEIVGTMHDDLIVGSADPDLTNPSLIDTIYGDSSGTLGTLKAGNDVILGVDGYDNLRGDAAALDGLSATAFARGGDDVINVGTSGTGSNDARRRRDTIGLRGGRQRPAVRQRPGRRTARRSEDHAELRPWRRRLAVGR